MNVVLTEEFAAKQFDDELLFDLMSTNIATQGYSIHPNSLPPTLLYKLHQHVQTMPDNNFKRAGIGREDNLMVNNFVRKDEVCWINGESDAGKAWLDWAADLQRYLNRHLFLGLFSFESHFAHYSPGDYYKKHKDAFKGQANRVLSVVVYLNPDWIADDGGELVMYHDETQEEILKVTPGFGTIVAFLSEEFPHEVLPASRDRYSIAGWYRVNSSGIDKVDPPR
ncbi:2OG-Fe(II) oxygenase [Vibrio rumoiensis]|uniref:2OG-Fe(II) oxygenase n=1 Tax=Vibrio rumoiensis 1S-45 TaxID=1188252 RepID=A0A1E5E5B3_9VIBR|nr:2OG-Fe(II) oxygenase [Vibrio rumoiensis]OEF28597.1 2OG-Fe(II) oxygenase [Vibrio rumoiensis 1S-45]